jgi:hypothetical protein
MSVELHDLLVECISAPAFEGEPGHGGHVNEVVVLLAKNCARSTNA